MSTPPSPNTGKLLILNLAALSSWELNEEDCPHLWALAQRGSARPARAPAPALTCPSHASMITGLSPREHGVVANGWFDPTYSRVMSWQRSDQVLNGERLWEAMRARDPHATSVSLFWRFCTHSSCDLTLTERPTYFANGRKGADVYASDPAFKRALIKRLGAFPFFHFWGPKAGVASSVWILKALAYTLEERTPNLALCYAPGLDYEGQRFGPRAPQARAALRELDAHLGELFLLTERLGYEVMVVSDYGFTEVNTPIALNRALRRAGHVAVDEAVNGDLLEPNASRAFAVCDNQVAHVYVRGAQGWGSAPEPALLDELSALLLAQEGVRAVYRRGEPADPNGPLSPDEVAGLWHERAGALCVIAEPNAWFTYEYWLDEARAPDFKHCVDIFNKPGFDPTEMFMRPGLGGVLHAAKRFAQLKLGIRAPFDVIAAEPSMVRGARAIAPSSLRDEGAVIMTSWPLDEGDSGEAEACALQDVKALALQALLNPAH